MSASSTELVGTMARMSPLLEARGLVKRLGGRLVVDGVDLVCHGGQVLGLLGPNGAGKTTTLRMLYGFLHPDAGVIRIDGSDDADHARVGMQEPVEHAQRRGLAGAVWAEQ